jgi:hypothetical protein
MTTSSVRALSIVLLVGCSSGSPPVSGAIHDDSDGVHLGKIVAGATICQYPEMKPCATSASDGSYTLRNLSVSAEVSIVCTKDGFLTNVFPLPPDFDRSSPLDIVMLQTQNDLFIAPTGVTQDPAKAMAIVTLLDIGSTGGSPPAAGSTVTLAPASGDGPFYIDVSGSPFSASPMSTSNSPLVLFMNLDPGTYSFTPSVSGKSCFEAFGWPAAGGAVTGPNVSAGTALSLSIGCE